MSKVVGNKASATDTGSQNLLNCDICGRHFTQDALTRHQPICRKVFNKKRKPFNSLKQRLEGTDIPTVKRKPPPKSQPEKKSNWRQQHENFISAIQAAKLATIAMKEGRPLPPPPPPTINPGCLKFHGEGTSSGAVSVPDIGYHHGDSHGQDYIQCPYCKRRFNEAAAERHINFCKEQTANRAFAPGQKGKKPLTGKQATSKKEPTVTSAVGTLLQNRSQDNSRHPVTGISSEEGK